ncbi:DUF4926 domain-containing protein [Chroococcidiopsis sp. CCALA 051]|uniref:DUF4926 domain-containing protein n=1 Tax=Chroococcidiopsis sp. CCALA 051 TaxID=869949 RepID=UPI000D0D0469|nr:DUF4926 domain-containing protein [Chroococcidiopsis sp. CCALA 051]MBE9014593.1 DUF4926 domain-containing protein [Chroococcidiopsidales cyanobacterium LEGE 13417]PSM48968.1 DUF4926 domain-containing protein [Chroococcidiopsis sp. CCALA 051]
MNFEFYQRVALTRDLSEHQLKIGDVATLIDFVPHPSSGEDGCVLEVFSATGESIAVVIVPKSDLKPLKNDEILTVRSLAEAS